MLEDHGSIHCCRSRDLVSVSRSSQELFLMSRSRSAKCLRVRGLVSEVLVSILVSVLVSVWDLEVSTTTLGRFSQRIRTSPNFLGDIKKGWSLVRTGNSSYLEIRLVLTFCEFHLRIKMSWTSTQGRLSLILVWIFCNCLQHYSFFLTVVYF